MTILEQRVEKLERENRRMKKTGLVAIVVALVLTAGAANNTKQDADIFDVVRAREFCLYDSDDKMRGFWAMEKDGPRLVLVSGSNKAYLDVGRSTANLTVVHSGHQSSLFAGKELNYLVSGAHDGSYRCQFGWSKDRGNHAFFKKKDDVVWSAR